MSSEEETTALCQVLPDGDDAVDEQRQVAVASRGVTEAMPGRQSPESMGERADSFETEHFSTLIVDEDETTLRDGRLQSVEKTGVFYSSDDETEKRKKNVLDSATQAIVTAAPMDSSQLLDRLRAELVTLPMEDSNGRTAGGFSDSTLRILFSASEEEKKLSSQISAGDFSESEMHNLLTFLSGDSHHQEGVFYSKSILDLLQPQDHKKQPVTEARATEAGNDCEWKNAPESVQMEAQLDMAQNMTSAQVSQSDKETQFGQVTESEKLQTEAVAFSAEVNAFSRLRVSLLNEQKTSASYNMGEVNQTQPTCEASEFSTICALGKHKINLDQIKSSTGGDVEPVMCEQCSKEDVLRLTEVGRTLDALQVGLSRAAWVGVAMQSDGQMLPDELLDSIKWTVSEEKQSEVIREIAETKEAIREILSRALILVSAEQSEEPENAQWIRLREIMRPIVLRQAREIEQIVKEYEPDDVTEFNDMPRFTAMAQVDEKTRKWIRLREKVSLCPSIFSLISSHKGTIQCHVTFHSLDSIFIKTFASILI